MAADRSITARLLEGAAWGAAAALSHAMAGGSAWGCSAFLLCAFACSSSTGHVMLSSGMLLMLSAATVLPGGLHLLPPVALLGIVLADGFAERALLALSIPLAGQVTGSTPLAVLGAAAVLSAMPSLRAARMAGLVSGIVLILFLAGPPLPGDEAEMVVQERLSGGDVTWDRFHLDFSNPSVLLRIPYIDSATLKLSFEGGGTRDRMPVGLVFTDEAVYSVPPGESVLEIHLDGGFVSIRLARQFRPFEHPVLHVLEAVAHEDP